MSPPAWAWCAWARRSARSRVRSSRCVLQGAPARRPRAGAAAATSGSLWRPRRRATARSRRLDCHGHGEARERRRRPWPVGLPRELRWVSLARSRGTGSHLTPGVRQLARKTAYNPPDVPARSRLRLARACLGTKWIGHEPRGTDASQYYMGCLEPRGLGRRHEFRVDGSVLRFSASCARAAPQVANPAAIGCLQLAGSVSLVRGAPAPGTLRGVKEGPTFF